MKTPEQNMKPVVAVAPISISAAGNETSAAIDTMGFKYACVVTTMGVGDSALATTVTECATSGGTYTAVNDEESTPAAVSLAHSASDDGTLEWGALRLDRRERYLKVDIAATGGSASLATAVVILCNSLDAAHADVAPAFLV